MWSMPNSKPFTNRVTSGGTRGHVLAWRANLESQGLAESSIRRKLAALASLFDYPPRQSSHAPCAPSPVVFGWTIVSDRYELWGKAFLDPVPIGGSSVKTGLCRPLDASVTQQ